MALELDGDWARQWNTFLSELKKAHIRLNDNPDEIIWELNKHGAFYTTKLGHQALFKHGNDVVAWWTRFFRK